MSDSGIDAATMKEHEERFRDEAEIITYCYFCKWKFKGSAIVGRQKALEHREKRHPQAKRTTKRRHTRHLSSFRTAGYDEQWKNEVDAERKKRAFLHGVDLDSA